MRLRLLCVGLLIAGCGGSAETPQAGTEGAVMPANISLADVAGTWDAMGIGETGDTTRFNLVTTATMDGWRIEFNDTVQPDMRVQAVEGDSIITEAGPFPSQIREGATVTVRSVIRLVNGAIDGTYLATYGDGSTLTGRIVGTRKP